MDQPIQQSTGPDLPGPEQVEEVGMGRCVVEVPHSGRGRILGGVHSLKEHDYDQFAVSVGWEQVWERGECLGGGLQRSLQGS